MFRAFIATASLAALVACGQPVSPAENPGAAEPADPAAGTTSQVLNIYSARHYDSDKAMYAKFEEETGIKVNVRESGAPELLETMKAEGADSPADVIIVSDAGALYQFQREGFTQPIRSDALEAAIPEQLREKDGHWFGLAKRARVIVYDPQLLPLEEVDTYADLAEDRLRGELCVRSSTNIYNLSLLGEIIGRLGSDAAETWAKGVASNFARPPEGGDTAQIEAVAAGQCAAAIVNHYYWVRLATGTTEERLTAAKTLVSFPDQDAGGTHINVTGAAVSSTSRSPDLAVKFIEFLTTPDGQALLTSETKEYPIVASAPVPEGLELLANFKQSDFPLSELGAHQAEAQAIFDRAGWN
ncbi:MAG: extracellular solute-binding protein [Hyphomonas sp.]|uniref:extracellular solute-binding protein n=1 Tax=Hyphomonas sp. TaxID=87 RepID=UPI0017A61FFF|nr:extracellular solute-binding protein [Hyphomonas sp.]MBA3067938.1 extracellular solute-binding protein [Hyphomonas sp.]MBU3919566.1 extracellular solute-binding protein [Alphaproteobacteria bacterium]MBU4061276.1 extracellular solute-binding protein [Alphaproteobacteria bacterium]MBU4162529.1 extracellular solute-binding protein [Alphaproteobacteria bacterium]